MEGEAMDWNAVFGEDDSLSLDELTKRLDGKKLVDLSEGGYVGKEKFDAETKRLRETATAATEKLAEYEKALDGDDGLKKQVESLTAELADAKKAAAETGEKLTRTERAALVSEKAAHLNAKMRRALVDDASALVTDTIDFEAALAKAIKDDPDYAVPEKDDDTTVIVRGGDPVKEPPVSDAYKTAIDAALPDRSGT